MSILPENWREMTGQEYKMKVCMMGPRAAGKTTILTSIMQDTKESLSLTKLTLTPSNATGALLTNYKRMLAGAFNSNEPAPVFKATPDVTEFFFDFGRKGGKTRIDLAVKDFPGEYVKSDPEVVTSFIEESNIIMIAIDSPYIMEENGKYGEIKNSINDITSYFEKCISGLASNKLILFVPLKCEKYAYTGQMEVLLQRVEEAYCNLIKLFTDNSDKITCAVTPIFTLGGVVFDQFTANKEDSSCPASLYKFSTENRTYSPSYCVQPLYYMLSFMSTEYLLNKEKGNWLDKLLKAVFKLFDNDPELFNEILKMEQYRKSEGNGYKVICGKDKFNYNR